MIILLPLELYIQLSRWYSMTDFNMIKKRTDSQKIRKITVLKKFILDTLDSDQEIKRYLRYLTTTPIAKRGIGYDGATIIQNDLTTSLKSNSDEGEKALYSGGFDPMMETIVKNYVFVQHYRSRIQSNGMDMIYFTIHILIPEKYNELKNYGEERAYQIADRVCQLLDTHIIENDEIVDIVGNVKFEVFGDIVEERLTKTKDVIILTIPIRIASSTLRVWDE